MSPRPFTRKNARSYPFLSKDKRSTSKIRAFFWGVLKKVQKILTSRSLKKIAKKFPERLSKLKVINNIPTMIVYGDRDTVTPTVAYKILEEALPNAEIVKFHGDHGISHEQAEKFNSVLYDFCKRNNGYA